MFTLMQRVTSDSNTVFTVKLQKPLQSYNFLKITFSPGHFSLFPLIPHVQTQATNDKWQATSNKQHWSWVGMGKWGGKILRELTVLIF